MASMTSITAALQGYLAHKKQRPPMTPQWDCVGADQDGFDDREPHHHDVEEVPAIVPTHTAHWSKRRCGL